MARDTPGLILDDPPFPYAYGVRVLECWEYARADVLMPDVLVKQTHWGANPPQHWRKQYRRAIVATKKKFPHLKRPRACSEACVLYDCNLRHRRSKWWCR
jgi:hypothetical protein